MKAVEQVLELSRDSAGALRPEPLGFLISRLPKAVRWCTRMAIEGRSIASGRPPGWLEKASELRIRDAGVGADGRATVACELPRLRDAIGKRIAQRQLWRALPDSAQTALDLFGAVIADLHSRNAESESFDGQLLVQFARFEALFTGGLRAVTVPAGEATADLNADVVTVAKAWTARVPRDKRVSVLGRLDMIRHSESTFALQLDDGNEVRGVLAQGDMSQFKDFFGKRVLVGGIASFRPSGSLLRVVADAFTDGTGAPEVFARVPRPISSRPDQRQQWERQTPTTGVGAFFGIWPGDESDKDLLEALDEIR